MNDFIEAKSISFSYRVEDNQKPVNVFENLNVTIREGEMTAVLGHNGSGKSTFAKHLNAILLPSGGKVYVDGIDTADEQRLYDIRQKVGMVFQNPDNQIVATVVEEDVAFGLENIGVPPKEMRERVDRALMDVGIYEYKKHAPHRFVRWTKAEGRHRRHHCHAPEMHRPRRADRNARPTRQKRGHGDHP